MKNEQLQPCMSSTFHGQRPLFLRQRFDVNTIFLVRGWDSTLVVFFHLLCYWLFHAGFSLGSFPWGGFFQLQRDFFN